VCSKKKKGDKKVEEKNKKDLTGPTLLEMSDYLFSKAPTNRSECPQ